MGGFCYFPGRKHFAGIALNFRDSWERAVRLMEQSFPPYAKNIYVPSLSWPEQISPPIAQDSEGCRLQGCIKLSLKENLIAAEQIASPLILQPHHLPGVFFTPPLQPIMLHLGLTACPIPQSNPMCLGSLDSKQWPWQALASPWGQCRAAGMRLCRGNTQRDAPMGSSTTSGKQGYQPVWGTNAWRNMARQFFRGRNSRNITLSASKMESWELMVKFKQTKKTNECEESLIYA